MIDYDTIEINGKKIEVKKEKVTLYRQTTRDEQLLYKMPTALPVRKKTIYTIPIEAFEEIPEIVHINGKKYFKSEINEINQTHFKLIEM